MSRVRNTLWSPAAVRRLRSVIVAAALLPLAACGEDSTTPAAGVETFDLPADQIGYHVDMRLTNRGVLGAVLNSDTVFSFSHSRRHDLRGVSVIFFDENGGEAGRLTSRTGDYDTASGIFIARSDVVLISSGPEGERRLETEELHYHIRDDRLWTEEPFVLYEGDRTTRGTRFSTDAKFTAWEVTGIETQGNLGEEGIRF